MFYYSEERSSDEEKDSWDGFKQNDHNESKSNVENKNILSTLTTIQLEFLIKNYENRRLYNLMKIECEKREDFGGNECLTKF